MRQVILIVATMAAAVTLGWFIMDLPGSVEVRAGALVIEAGVPTALIAFIGSAFVLHLILRAVGALWRLPRSFGHWRQARRRARGDEAVTRALVALAAGTGAPAAREAARARAYLGDSAQTLLLVAEAERLAGRESQALRAYQTLSERPDTDLIGLRGLLRHAVTREDWVTAARLARLAEEAHPGVAWAREERAHLAIRAGDWEGALALATTDRARAALGTAASRAASDPDKAYRLARDAFRADDTLGPAAVAYIHAYHRVGDAKSVRAAARKAWKSAPSAELAAAALDAVADKLARVSAAGSLVELNPHDTESHILLARVALDAGLAGMARDHLEALRARGVDQPRVWTLLTESATDPVEKTEARRRFEHAKGGPRWSCDTCGVEAPTWGPVCGACLTAGGLRRGEATEPKRLLAS